MFLALIPIHLPPKAALSTTPPRYTSDMGTPAQAAASRANGALSHGPRSAETKAISSRNSLKLGIDAQAMIIPGEDPVELERLTAEYHDRFHPVGPVESAVLKQAIRAQWLRDRYYRIETDVINMRAAAHTETEHAVGAAFDQDAKSGNTLQRLFRRQMAADKDWFSALQLLDKLQQIRHRAEFEEQQLALESAAELPAPRPASSDSRVRFDTQPLRAPQPAPHPVDSPVNLVGVTALSAGIDR